MASFQLLEPREEEELHKSRLLNVEEKPFKRISKRLLTPGAFINTPNKFPTPPPDSASEVAAEEAALQKIIEQRRQFREDVMLDFAAFDSSIARIQFLRNSNERERERYKADKQRILETAQEVRENTAQLRVQLEESMRTLEQRKKFDELAEKITNNRLLRPREDQQINLRKLEDECRDLERESAAYGETWKERREQFGRIMDEAMHLRRLIRDEKEEVERREGMEGDEEDGEAGEGSVHHSQSGHATPAPDGDGGLKPRPLASGALSKPTSRATSRAPSPAVSERLREDAVVDNDDSMMTDSGLKATDIVADTAMADSTEIPVTTVTEPTDGTPLAAEDGEVEDKMDTT